jgi:PAS domain S-box-containing protein
VNEDTRQAVDNPVERVIREGLVVGLANHTVLVRPDRTEVPIDDSAAPIRDHDGRLIGAVLVFRDISARKKSELQVQRWNTELEARVRERTG